MSRHAWAVVVGLGVAFSSAFGRADTRLVDPDEPVKPTGYARTLAGKPPAFDEDRIAKFLVAARWEPIYESEPPDPSQPIDPGIQFVDPAKSGPAKKPNIVHVPVGSIERRTRTTIIAVDAAGYELKPCARKPKFSCLYPRAGLYFDVSTGSATAATSTSASPRNCAELKRELDALKAKMAAEVRRLQEEQRKLHTKLK